jgi:hypothetical protein
MPEVMWKLPAEWLPISTMLATSWPPLDTDSVPLPLAGV